MHEPVVDVEATAPNPVCDCITVGCHGLEVIPENEPVFPNRGVWFCDKLVLGIVLPAVGIDGVDERPTPPKIDPPACAEEPKPVPVDSRDGKPIRNANVTECKGSPVNKFPNKRISKITTVRHVNRNNASQVMCAKEWNSSAIHSHSCKRETYLAFGMM